MGTLAVRTGPTIQDAVAGSTLFEWHAPEGPGGFMEHDELKSLTAGVLDLPDAESAEESNGIPAQI